MTEQTPKEALAQTMQDLELTIDAVFVPWSKSRGAKNGATKVTDRSLNWKITLKRRGHEILTTDYTAGIGNCPSYRPGARLTLDYVDALVYETESGRERRGSFGGKALMPDSCDVMASLVSDGGAIDSATFEQWASDLGYDTDSRKAERTYRECLETGLVIRAAVGDDGWRRLQEACQNY